MTSATATKGDRMIDAVISMTQALKEDDYRGNWGAFYKACAYGGFEDLAAMLWEDIYGLQASV